MKLGSYLLCLTGVFAMGAPLADEIASTPVACAYDKDAMLALDEPAFDQDIGGEGGWRSVANIDGCQVAAADLIAEYRAQHPDGSNILAWHEGQMRAMAGQTERAIPLLDDARKSDAEDLGGWNPYVDATVAFLRNDKPALLDARTRLAAVGYPADMGPPPVDGYIELPTQPGQPPMRVRWPPNIDVVDGLVACFGKTYSEAYGSEECRK